MAKGNVLKEKKKEATSKVEKSGSKLKFTSLFAQVDKRKAKSITGAFFLLMSIYLTIACFSYLFTWKADQSMLANHGFWEFMFSDTAIEVQNWLGKFGAWTSHIMIHSWFGIASFAFCFILFIAGVRLLFNIRIFSIKRTLLVSTVSLVWLSLFLGLFSEKITFLGGTFGYYAREWLSASFGIFGTVLFVIVALFVASVLLFNPDFKALFAKLPFFSDASDDEDESAVGLNDLKVINTLKEEDLEPGIL